MSNLTDRNSSQNNKQVCRRKLWKRCTRIAAIATLLISYRASATLTLPSNLTTGEQELVLQILGFGTSFKAVNNPYPLGGYSGLELGVAVENIPTADIGLFGAQAPVSKNTSYPRFTIGKGVYDSTDLFFSFIPYNETTGIGVFSGALRWGFFQASFVPACFSILISGSHTVINNLFTAQTYGVDLVAGVNVDTFSFYAGAGTIYGQGKFDPSLTNGNLTTTQHSRTVHTTLGLNVSIAEFFTALQMDVYSVSTISLKLGARL